MARTKKVLEGVTVAMAVASLVGFASEGDTTPPVTNQPNSDTTDMMHCYSINVCKGHNDCKTVANACAGFSSCKGEGFLSMSPEACANVGGTRKDDSLWQESTADLINCSGVNVNGDGFVAMPAKSCTDMGGTVED